MLLRRSFLSYGVAMISSLLATPQTAVLKGEKAIACDGAITTCPNGHKTCRNIDMPIVIGNDNRNYPEPRQLFDYRLMCCTSCSVLFVEKQ